MATKETTESLLKILFAKGERITSNELEEIIVKIKKDDKRQSSKICRRNKTWKKKLNF